VRRLDSKRDADERNRKQYKLHQRPRTYLRINLP
jgi:hypothetical protein